MQTAVFFRHKKSILIGLFVVLTMIALLFVFSKKSTAPNSDANNVQVSFSDKLTGSEQSKIYQVINESGSERAISVDASLGLNKGKTIAEVFVPVTSFKSSITNIDEDDLTDQTAYFSDRLDQKIIKQTQELLKLTSVRKVSVDDISKDQVVFISISELKPSLRLLSLNDEYYLDNFDSGAIFHNLSFEGGATRDLSGLKYIDEPSKDSVFKVNMTGVTALTRVLIRELNKTNDPKYFSQKIGPFLADADLTHISNEISFQDNCPFEVSVSFCSPPEFIETLKDSGVDLVELTGNHNNDKGHQNNVETINLYHSLGWSTVGGGTDLDPAQKPYLADQKGSKVTFIAYNDANSVESGVIATHDSAGANPYSDEQARSDIKTAKETSDFVIVSVQYKECYAYPGGYLEYPQCDQPIAGQSELFKKLIDMGADMVIGSAAHQPQTFEMYKSKPIYYGLGNLYFDQIEQPGTQRSIILTHYFMDGKLLQTKLTPTFYDRDFVTRKMTEQETKYFLRRLSK